MTGLLALLDDIATTLDDISVMTKIAMKKTGALMTDDLAVNAGVLQGAKPTRELSLVLKIFLGSLVNKVIAISVVLFILNTYPPLINALLLCGGLYLAYEGVHKILEKALHKKKAVQKNIKEKIIKAPVFDEKKRVWGAIKTDLILSLEIIVIANSSIKADMMNRSLTLCVVGLAASLIIYGLVALILQIDDFGLWLVKKQYEKVGTALVRFMPYLMKGLGMAGTVAMLLVGGGIVTHLFHLPLYLPEVLQNALVGWFAGLAVVIILYVIRLLRSRQSVHIP